MVVVEWHKLSIFGKNKPFCAVDLSHWTWIIRTVISRCDLSVQDLDEDVTVDQVLGSHAQVH